MRQLLEDQENIVEYTPCPTSGLLQWPRRWWDHGGKKKAMASLGLSQQWISPEPDKCPLCGTDIWILIGPTQYRKCPQPRGLLVIDWTLYRMSLCLELKLVA